jgi:hypothetical protein
MNQRGNLMLGFQSRFRVGLALVGLAFIGAGCSSSGPEIASVVGKVTMDGKPLANATVVFIPENGRPSGATTDAEGDYVLNFAQGRRGAIPGPSTIRISTLRDAGQDENGQSTPGSPETIPARYNADSVLEFIVEPKKKNIANFELESRETVASRSR